MNLIIDGIIEKLQDNGGCTVYFNQILSFFQKSHNTLSYLKYTDKNNINIFNGNISYPKERALERWLDVDIHNHDENTVFHSTHYRLPRNKKNIKIVTTVHDFTYELYRSGPSQWMHSWQKNRAIKKSDLVICVSKNTADDLMKFCPISPDKIRVVYNGVSDAYYPLNQYENGKNVVFIGARGWYKNFTLAVKAISRTDDFTLQIVGGGALSEDEIELLETFLPNRYNWLGRLTDDELNLVYNKAYCLLYPSSYEGFGIPVAEAMRAGCPVIAINTSSIPEVAGDAAILLDEPREELIEDAILSLGDVAYRNNLVSRGITQANKFAWQKCYQDTLNVYLELVTNE
ncbi:glycosyltransferase family 4 protein [Photobacterium damselae]|uniref:glycosyltransferase family 4 protein n=1 Tax=Photobacterium damselae TaxID=38293 RepID=UPI000D99C950|nr:glycosyltransferase family 1 protein [Photobacterium damselae]NVO72601.1 glycosyltransferase family 4 protein [Photobacterium damselae subsp. damselae]UKA07006.1 glycosyltransferase family 4 protein [Photobacterium damselae subsp. damselae]UKA22112.1 glycosyltransferase family 4 protein [Photobacterium damselae subsp. damselae]SPY22981.1 D-inositol-3-phosphate glycosyltransferase [Photobacterium damselae]